MTTDESSAKAEQKSLSFLQTRGWGNQSGIAIRMARFESLPGAGSCQVADG